MRKVRIQIYQDAAALWRWRLVASNGKLTADSGESYSRRDSAQRAARRLRDWLVESHIEIEQ